MVKKQSTMVVKQKRGTVTLMDSIAANEFTHCIMMIQFNRKVLAS